MDVNSMWACLQDHDTANHWKQVAGWRKVCDLAQTHLGRLQEYRRGLAEAWPPETSAASSTYLAELDELIDKVRRTHDAAAANYTALSAATQAIGTTRAALRKIHEEYAGKLQQKQAYDTIAADPKAVLGSRITEPPVTDGELERLNVQARAMMFSLSGELQQAQATLQKPPARPAPRVDEQTSNTVTESAPIIPPIAPVPIRPTPRHSTSPTSADGGIRERLPIERGIGPILGSATAIPIPSSQDLARAQQAGQVVQPPAPAVAPHLRPNPGILRIDGKPPSQGGRNGSQTPDATRVNGVNSTTPPRSLPPSGLIGGAPGVGINQPSNAPSAPRKVNPIGGVIGGGSAGTTPTGGAGSRPSAPRAFGGAGGTLPIGGSPSSGSNWQLNGAPARPARRVRDNYDDEHAQWDPEHPWRTEKGVTPVVMPPDEDGPIDPGPALGLPR
ncbi:hypothetical protein O7634_14035 [Micromonospora sp. WMMD1120]|nr:hypothetical protein [Micromonospora sp. WMMD1120]MDG4807871.1 hypothetical protein [Micromonospora sp. WMMD1120]